MAKPRNNHPIIIFDGVCNVCNASVNFIIQRDPEALFHFTSMQSEQAKVLMQEYGLEDVGFDSFILIKKGESFIRSEAVLEVCKDLKGFWFLFSVFKIVPVVVRDCFYKLFARNRYRIFGKKESCMMPTEEIQSRFLK